MSLFKVNTGLREQEVCGLKWADEIEVPELNTSVFLIEGDKVKNGQDRLVVLNRVARSVIESVRGQHPEDVFVRFPKPKKSEAAHPPAARKGLSMTSMNNTAWQRAREAAGLGDLHVHDLRHTTGMRLREAGVSQSTRADILWHTSPSMTHHYSMAQIVEVHAALEKITDDNGCWNKSLGTLRLEQEATRRDASPPKVPQQRKTA
jgi:integrase